MGKLFNIFKHGFITIFTSPFWLCYFLYNAIKGLGIFVIYIIKFIFSFFTGKSIFKTKEDKAIEQMKKQDVDDLAQRRKEALKNVK